MSKSPDTTDGAVLDQSPKAEIGQVAPKALRDRVEDMFPGDFTVPGTYYRGTITATVQRSGMHILAQAMDGEKPRAEISRVLAASNRGVRSLYRLFRTDHMDRVIELSVPEVDGEYGEVQLSGLQVSEYTPQRLLEEAKTMGVI